MIGLRTASRQSFQNDIDERTGGGVISYHRGLREQEGSGGLSQLMSKIGPMASAAASVIKEVAADPVVKKLGKKVIEEGAKALEKSASKGRSNLKKAKKSVEEVMKKTPTKKRKQNVNDVSKSPLLSPKLSRRKKR